MKAVLSGFLALLIPALAGAQSVTCEGHYPRHLQGICSNQADSYFWCWTDVLVKTDLTGKLLAKVPVADHHGDLCHHDGRVYVAVNLGKFNLPPGAADSWVYVYDAANLKELARHPVPEVVHGAGGMAYRDGRFFIVGGLPTDGTENYVYEYGADFRFIQRRVLASGHTDKGIQTVTWANGAWWFGCYGEPKILLRADESFQFKGRWEFDASLGIEQGPEGTLLIGTNRHTKDVGFQGHIKRARVDSANGLVLK